MKDVKELYYAFCFGSNNNNKPTTNILTVCMYIKHIDYMFNASPMTFDIGLKIIFVSP